MGAIPAKLNEAFEKIRLGKVEEGTRLFDRVDAFDAVKSVALAELSYFRHDWVWGIQFIRVFFESEHDWETVRYFMRGYKELHLKVFLLCTCHLDSWKESRSYLQQLRKKYDTSSGYTGNYNNTNMYQQAISLISDSENTKRLLLESSPKLKEKGKINLDYLKQIIKRAVPKRKHWRQSSYDDLTKHAYDKASTEDHIVFYEQYIDQLEEAETHQDAAKSYIALENEQGTKEAIRRYMRCWKFKEPFQVAPIVLFTDPELWPIMSDHRFSESLLTIPHHRES